MSHAGAPNTEATVSAVRAYWDSHPLGLQYVTDPSIEVGTPEFFEHIRPWMNPYKFPWIMDRIEREINIPKELCKVRGNQNQLQAKLTYQF